MFRQYSICIAGIAALSCLTLVANPSSLPAPQAQSKEVTVKGYITDTLSGKNSANKGYEYPSNYFPYVGIGKPALYDDQTKMLFILNKQNLALFRGFRIELEGTLSPSPLKHAGQIINPKTGLVQGAFSDSTDHSTPIAGVLNVTSIAYLGEDKDPWVKKDWTQWTRQDCTLILYASPWARRGIPEFDYDYYGNEYESTLVVLRSALPIRQAALRLAQLENNYDKMKPDKKKAFDQAHAHDLDPEDQVRIVVESRKGDYWASRNAALRLSDGTFVEPIQVNRVKVDDSSSLNDQFEYIFPRKVGGKVVFSPGDLAFQVDLGAPLTINKKTKQVVPEPFHPVATDGGSFVRTISVDSKLFPPPFRFPILTLAYKGKLEY
jgi:hypothetical protein